MSHKLTLQQKIYRQSGSEALHAEVDRPLDLQGWGSTHPYFERLISAGRPRTIVEIGVWKGASTVHMASLLKRYNVDGCVLAVDTWLGASDHWTDGKWFPELSMENGYPTIFRQFLANCQKSSVMDYVLPLPLDSVNAAATLTKLGIKINMLHIDAGHDFNSVASDLANWFPLLSNGGAVICDDYRLDGGWPEVKAAVDVFTLQNKIKIELVSPPKCVFYKKS